MLQFFHRHKGRIMTLKYDLIMANHAPFYLLTALEVELPSWITWYLLYEHLKSVIHIFILSCSIEYGCHPSVPFPFWVGLHSPIFQRPCRWQFACLHEDRTWIRLAEFEGGVDLASMISSLTFSGHGILNLPTVTTIGNAMTMYNHTQLTR